MRFAVIIGAMLSLSGMGAAQADAPAPLPPLFIPPPPIDLFAEIGHEIVVGSILDTQPPAPAPVAPAAKPQAAPKVAPKLSRGASPR